MPETVKLPAIGPVKKQWVWVGGAAVAGIVGYAWFKRGTGHDVTTPTEGDTSAADNLGYTPDAFQGATVPGGSTVVGTVPGEGPPTTNAEWSQRLVDMLEGVGYDRNLAANTLGKYLSGQPLSAAEALLVRAAIGLLGNPPAGALPIITNTSTTTGGGSTEPTTPSSTSWQGHKVTPAEAAMTFRDFAKKYSGNPNNATANESTLRQIKLHNPTILATIGGNSHLKAGWIILVPIHH